MTSVVVMGVFFGLISTAIATVVVSRASFIAVICGEDLVRATVALVTVVGLPAALLWASLVLTLAS